MSKTLFEEAVADANKLRELAEETAKNRVVEAVMPQIRDMINKKILGEDLDVEQDIDDLDLSLEPEPVDTSEPVKIGLDSDDEGSAVSINVDGDVEIDLEVDAGDEGEELVMDQAMAEALTRLIRGEASEKSETEVRIDKLAENVNKLGSVLRIVKRSDLNESQVKRLKLSYLYCLREAIKLKSGIILTEDTTQERLERRLTETIKEIRNMSKSNRRNIFDFLFEGEDEKKKMEELEEAELSLELSADEQEELADAEDADAVGDALEDILGDIELSLGGGEEAAEEEDEEEGEEEEGEDEGEDEEVEVAEDEDLEEGDYAEGSHMDEGEDMDEVYEIDENMLRAELSKMLNEDDAVDADPALAHGGEEIGDVLLDVSEDDLINALADELGSVADSGAAAPAVAEGRQMRKLRRALKESRNQNAQYKRAVTELKGQLVEMNLFNAKLLYANKLMQNKDLSMKQQKAIVEALDNAQTLREAKLLFKSLTESLNRRSKKTMNEGSLRTSGSSSRTTRSSAPKNTNNAEADRWAILAGLAK